MIISAIEADLGGADSLTAGEHVLAHRAVVATAMLEDMEALWLSGRPVDVAAYGTLTNVAARLLRTIGLQRRPRDVTPDLAAYVASRATADPAPQPDAMPLPVAAPSAP